MRQFIKRYGQDLLGVVSGFDRVRFRGTIRWLANLSGMYSFLAELGIRLTGFKTWSKGLTAQIIEASEGLTESCGRPMQYLQSSKQSKEELALEIAQQDGISEGLICLFKAVEPCVTFIVRPNRKLKEIELRQVPNKCLHYYFYVLHSHLGLIHFRLQTWLPFTIHVCLNGREWLARQLIHSGIEFEKRDNCFVQLADFPRAAELLNQQLRTNWMRLLDGLQRTYHPTHATLFPNSPLDIYWSAEQTEWATDVAFRSPETLQQHFPAFVRQAVHSFGSADVLRFLGRHPQVTNYHKGEIVTTTTRRPEGICVKHRLNKNSIKMYDKQGSVLRIETTINDPRDMKVFRPKEGDPQGPKSWQRLRKGVSDLERRAKVSQKANERYLNALASADSDQPLEDVVRHLCQPTQYHGRRVRALRPFSPEDSRLLAAVNRGEFRINGFRNRDLRALLFDNADTTPQETKRQAGKVTRLIRMLRGHNLIQKVSKTNRYIPTVDGQSQISAILAAQQATPEQLAQLAA